MKIKILVGITLFISFVVFTGIMVASLSSASLAPKITSTTPTTSTPIVTGTTLAMTVASVSTHNSANNCWLIINNSVYDLTQFANQHSGGAGPILQSCGQDATSYFNSKHGARQLAMLDSYFIGKISN